MYVLGIAGITMSLSSCIRAGSSCVVGGLVNDCGSIVLWIS